MVKTVMKTAPIARKDIPRIAGEPNFYYVFPVLLKEGIRKKAPAAPKEELNVSPYVLPGLKKRRR